MISFDISIRFCVFFFGVVEISLGVGSWGVVRVSFNFYLKVFFI